MALSMDEQRVLAEIERRLAAEEPGLAASLTNFRRPGPAAMLRSPRARIIGSLFTVLLVAMISLMVYAMIPFRAHGTRAPANRPGIVPSQTQLSAAGTGNPGRAGTVSASGGSLSGISRAGTSAGVRASARGSVRQDQAGNNTTASGQTVTRTSTSTAVRSGGTSGSASSRQGTRAKATGTSAADR